MLWPRSLKHTETNSRVHLKDRQHVRFQIIFTPAVLSSAFYKQTKRQHDVSGTDRELIHRSSKETLLRHQHCMEIKFWLQDKPLICMMSRDCNWTLYVMNNTGQDEQEAFCTGIIWRGEVPDFLPLEWTSFVKCSKSGRYVHSRAWLTALIPHWTDKHTRVDFEPNRWDVSTRW